MAQYHCNYCQENIFGLRVKCAVCSDFDLCLQCFCCGAEIGCHKNDHQYQIIDCGNFPIFEPPQKWKASEELRLLDAIEHYGFGNWDDIANEIQSRDAEEAINHYTSLYIQGNIGKATWPPQVSSLPKDHTCPDGGPLSPSLSACPPQSDLTPQEQQELGYMPNRDDFEREYDNEAELVASHLTVSQDDEDIDIALKLSHVDMFTWRLKERLRRKRIARDYNLVSLFYSRAGKNCKGPNSKKKHTKEDREFQERMRVFSQFQTCQDQEQLFESVQKEKELKSRIKELVRCRRNGLVKVEDCAEFDNLRYKRERRKENKKKSGSGGTVHHRKSSTASRKQSEKGGSANTSLEEPSAAGAADEAGSNSGVALEATAASVKEEESSHNEDADIELCVGHEMLSAREKKLCRTLGLRPAAYLTLKTVFLKDHLLRCQGIPVKSFHHHQHHLGVDRVRRRRILSFLVSCGWLTAT